MPAIPAPLVDRLLDIESETGALCPDTMNRNEAEQAVTRLVAGVRETIERLDTPSERVRALNHLVFEQQRVRSSADLHDACNLLPSAVLRRQQGYCLGVAAVYLAIAERLDLPVFAVTTPSHVFLRYDDGTTRINIETTAMGSPRTDQAYVDEAKIPEDSLRKQVFLRELSQDEFLAQIHNNLGVVYSERKDYPSAAREYERALALDERLPAAWYNLGRDHLRAGDFRGAIKKFSRSLDLYPTDVWALSNRGVAYKMLGKTGKARRDFELSLRLDPEFETAKRNLAILEQNGTSH